MTISGRPASTVQRLLPVLSWLPRYRSDWLLPDVLAGLAVWAVMVPEGMAYAGIVGVPPIMGLYTIVPPLIAYALVGTSRLLVVGPDTATGLISALTVGAIAVQGTGNFNTLTSTLAIFIGAFFLLFGALRMGWVAAFIPTPVMPGFIEGLVCVTIIGQVPHLLGIDGTSGNFFTKLWFVLEHLSGASLGPALIALLSLAAMLLLRHLAPRIPAPSQSWPRSWLPSSTVKRPVYMWSATSRQAYPTSRCPTSTPQNCGISRPARLRSCWSAMPRRWCTEAGGGHGSPCSGCVMPCELKKAWRRGSYGSMSRLRTDLSLLSSHATSPQLRSDHLFVSTDCRFHEAATAVTSRLLPAHAALSAINRMCRSRWLCRLIAFMHGTADARGGITTSAGGSCC